MTSTLKMAAAATVTTLWAASASAGCVGQPYNNDVSVGQNAYNAGVAAIEGHRRNSQTRNWDNIQRTFEPGVTAPGAPEQVNLSGHSFANAVRQCENYQGTIADRRAGLFDDSRDVIANDVMALTCNGREAYVALPNGQIYVVDRGSATPTTSTQLACRR